MVVRLADAVPARAVVSESSFSQNGTAGSFQQSGRHEGIVFLKVESREITSTILAKEPGTTGVRKTRLSQDGQVLLKEGRERRGLVEPLHVGAEVHFEICRERVPLVQRFRKAAPWV